MAGKFAVGLAMILLGLVAVSALDLNLDYADHELVHLSDSSLIELDAALEAMDQDFSEMESTPAAISSPTSKKNMTVDEARQIFETKKTEYEGLSKLSTKSGDAAIAAKAHAARKAFEDAKAALKAAEERRALHKKKRALKAKEKKLEKQKKTEAKLAKAEASAEQKKKDFEAKKAAKAAKKAAKMEALKNLANKVVGNTKLSPAVEPLWKQIEAGMTDLDRLLSAEAGKKHLDQFKQLQERIVKARAAIRNVERRAQKKELKAQKKAAKAAAEKAHAKKDSQKGKPAALVKEEKKKAKKDMAKAAKLALKAKKAKAKADAKAASLKKKVDKDQIELAAVTVQLEKSLSLEGQAKLKDILQKVDQMHKVESSEIKAAKAKPIYTPKFTRKEVIKADPKGKFKKLDPNGVTAAEARERINKMHEENKYHDFSTMKMDKLLGVVAKIPAAHTAF